MQHNNDKLYKLTAHNVSVNRSNLETTETYHVYVAAQHVIREILTKLFHILRVWSNLSVYETVKITTYVTTETPRHS